MATMLINGERVTLTAEQLAAFEATRHAPNDIPAEVTMRQARRALHAAGLLAGVEAALAALPEPQRTQAAIDWEFSNAVRRDNPTFIALASALGLSSDQLDDLFIAAAGVP